MAVFPEDAFGFLARATLVMGGLLLVAGGIGGCTSASEQAAESSADTMRTSSASAADADSTARSRPDRPEGGASDAGERTLDEQLAEARLEARVTQALMQSRSLRVFELRPTVRQGRVVLEGDVNTRDQYDEAARTARRVEGVEAVRNELTVGGAPVSEAAPEEESAEGAEGTGGAVYHTVQSGESLWAIAQRYGTSPQRLRALNDLTGGSLQPGQRIRVR
jgi:osmotically-inducible protein OsmY